MIAQYTVLKQLWYKFELSVFIKKSLYRPKKGNLDSLIKTKTSILAL